jgi:hypothetical protein
MHVILSTVSEWGMCQWWVLLVMEMAIQTAQNSYNEFLDRLNKHQFLWEGIAMQS